MTIPHTTPLTRESFTSGRMVRSFKKNPLGRDFVVGDVHGRLKELKRALNAVNFELTKDRLFALGDLGDRGKDSKAIYELLDQDWFFSIMGNHDYQIIEVMEKTGVALIEALDTQKHNGGKWFQKLSKSTQLAIYQRVKALPMAIELEAEFGKIGLVHAEVPKPFTDWQSFTQALPESKELRQACLWKREAISDGYDYFRGKYIHPDYQIKRSISGIDATIHGHTSVYEPVIWGNQTWIDTGGKTGELTVLEVKSIERLKEMLC